MWYDPDEEAVFVEKTDQCYKCENAKECPLHIALVEGMVLMALMDFRVKNCGMYSGPPKAKLKLVPPGVKHKKNCDCPLCQAKPKPLKDGDL